MEIILVEDLASILDMRKKTPKESVVKVLWNLTAKQLQEHFLESTIINLTPSLTWNLKKGDCQKMRSIVNYNRIHRRERQNHSIPRELEKIIKHWDETIPEILQRKFFHIAAYKLSWRRNEGAFSCVEYFVEELDHQAKATGRIEYYPVFSKASQGSSKKLPDSKWLIPNITNP